MIEIPHPRALLVTLVLLAAAVGALEMTSTDVSSNATVDTAVRVGDGASVDLTDAEGRIHAERLYESTPDRIERKASEYDRAIELQNPTRVMNAENVSLSRYVGEKVILLEFWTHGCYNCQNTHPYIKGYWREYEDEGLVVIGVHYPEFDYERKPANVREYLEKTNTTYPVVLDNDGGTWNAYDQRYWPTRYLIGVDGFVRYKHIGEGAYNETEREIRALLAERDEVVNATTEK